MVVITRVSNDSVAASAPHANTAEASQNGDNNAENNKKAGKYNDGNDPTNNTSTISATTACVLQNKRVKNTVVVM